MHTQSPITNASVSIELQHHNGYASTRNFEARALGIGPSAPLSEALIELACLLAATTTTQGQFERGFDTARTKAMDVLRLRGELPLPRGLDGKPYLPSTQNKVPHAPI